MIRVSRFALLGLLAALVALAGCQSEPETPAERPPIAMPTSQDDAEWQRYVGQMVSRHVRIRRGVPPFAVYISPDPSDDPAKNADAILINANMTLQRGVQKDTIVAFGSRDSALMASRMSEVFKDIPEDRLKGARVVFVGRATDRATAEAAIGNSGAEFIFVEFGT
jgi:hypothetical protein